jgi:hypothetical protein
MTAYRITYEGPSMVAFQAAALIADADGVELTGSQPPQRQPGSEAVILSLTVDGEEQAVRDAVSDVTARLPGLLIDLTEV